MNQILHPSKVTPTFSPRGPAGPCGPGKPRSPGGPLKNRYMQMLFNKFVKNVHTGSPSTTFDGLPFEDISSTSSLALLKPLSSDADRVITTGVGLKVVVCTSTSASSTSSFWPFTDIVTMPATDSSSFSSGIEAVSSKFVIICRSYSN